MDELALGSESKALVRPPRPTPSSAPPTDSTGDITGGNRARPEFYKALFHPDLTPIFESKGSTIRPVLRGDLLPSKQ